MNNWKGILRFGIGRYILMVLSLLTKLMHIFNTILINVSRGYYCCLYVSFFVVFSLCLDFVCLYKIEENYIKSILYNKYVKIARKNFKKEEYEKKLIIEMTVDTSLKYTMNIK